MLSILTPVTDNCPSWISGRERIAVQIISWPISKKECCRTWGLNPRPSAYRANAHPIELPLRLVKVKTMAFSETIVVYDIKVGRRSQLKWVHEALWVSKVKVIHWHWSNRIGFNIFQLLFLKLTIDFNISSPLRWAIQDQWSCGYLFTFLFILTFRTIIFSISFSSPPPY